MHPLKNLIALSGDHFLFVRLQVVLLCLAREALFQVQFYVILPVRPVKTKPHCLGTFVYTEVASIVMHCYQNFLLLVLVVHTKALCSIFKQVHLAVLFHKLVRFSSHHRLQRVKGFRPDQPDFDTAQGVSHDVVLSLHVLDPGDVVLLQVQGQPAQLSRQVHFSQQPLQWLVIGLDGKLASQ